MNNAPLICRNTVACLALLVPPAATPGVAEDAPPTTDVLTDKQWDDVDRSLERALAFLASNQRDDGSFRTTDNGQPGVTGLCVLAFLANGHTPGQGPYGEGLDQAVKFIVSCQKQNGLLSVRAP